MEFKMEAADGNSVTGSADVILLTTSVSSAALSIKTNDSSDREVLEKLYNDGSSSDGGFLSVTSETFGAFHQEKTAENDAALDESGNNWEQLTDEQGNLYYYNNITQESTWNVPEVWEMYQDEGGNNFLYNVITGESKWPEDDSYDDIVAQHEHVPEEADDLGQTVQVDQYIEDVSTYGSTEQQKYNSAVAYSQGADTHGLVESSEQYDYGDDSQFDYNNDYSQGDQALDATVLLDKAEAYDQEQIEASTDSDARTIGTLEYNDAIEGGDSIVEASEEEVTDLNLIVEAVNVNLNVSEAASESLNASSTIGEPKRRQSLKELNMVDQLLDEAEAGLDVSGDEMNPSPLHPKFREEVTISTVSSYDDEEYYKTKKQLYSFEKSDFVQSLIDSRNDNIELAHAEQEITKLRALLVKSKQKSRQLAANNTSTMKQQLLEIEKSKKAVEVLRQENRQLAVKLKQANLEIERLKLNS